MVWLSAGSQREPARSRRVRPHRALSTAQGSFCSNKQLRKTFTAELKIVRTRLARPLACPTVTHVAALLRCTVFTSSTKDAEAPRARAPSTQRR